jgi:cytochrome c
MRPLGADLRESQLLRSIFAVAALSLVATPALAAPDGAQLFNMRCKACHSGGPIAPALKGVAGSKVASKPGFKYSDGLKKKGGVWTDANLNAFLAGPTKFAPGTRMMVTVAKPEDRAAIVAHLKTLK